MLLGLMAVVYLRLYCKFRGFYGGQPLLLFLVSGLSHLSVNGGISSTNVNIKFSAFNTVNSMNVRYSGWNG